MSISNRKPGTPKEAPAEPLKRAISGAMKAIAAGDHDVVIPYADHRNEVGDMARTLDVFAKGLSETERLRA